jgi:hypothetical protein
MFMFMWKTQKHVRDQQLNKKQNQIQIHNQIQSVNPRQHLKN